ncbi:MAG TPA: O-methyltransferase [Terracidiphilus sp.]|jgi:predicted O-methyltransferase YrrM|nr:O-methyltransferase [Terracidiphilus sp.]
MQEIWVDVDRYLGDQLAPHDAALAQALDANHESGLPAIDVPPLLGKFLHLLIRISGARRVLEIGTLGGYSTIWMARALPAGGQLLSLEIDARNAEIARNNLKTAGVLDRVEVRVAPAGDSLRALVEDGSEPFDFIFMDADKKSLPEYLDWSLKLSHPGAILVADNVVRDGRVVQADSTDPDIQGIRRFVERVASNPRLSATAIPTVGARGYDGVLIALVMA